MADYATLLRDRGDAQGAVNRSDLPAGVRTEAALSRSGVPLPPLAEGLSDSLVGRVRQDRGRVRESGRSKFAKRSGTPIVHFKKGENKEERMRPLLGEAARQGGEGRVVLIGAAQERASAWRSWKAKGQEQAAHPHIEWGRQMAYINHYYIGRRSPLAIAWHALEQAFDDFTRRSLIAA